VEINPADKYHQQQMDHLATTRNLFSWNPEKYPSDASHVMPVLTTTYPLINSTFNVGQHTLKLIQEKMSDAAVTCDQILDGQKPWEALFKTCHIFHEYEHFLVVIASAINHIQWFGLIESKLKYFIQTVEKEASIDSSRIWPKPLTRRAEKTNSMTQLWFIGLNYCSKESINILGHLKYFQEHLQYQAENFASQDMNIEAHIVQKSDLKRHLTDKEIQEILSAQSQKRDTWFHKSRSDSSSSNGSGGGATYAGVTKSNSFSRNRSKIVTVSAASEQPQLPSPYHMPCVPTLVNMNQPPPASHRNFFGSPTNNNNNHFSHKGIYKTPSVSSSAADTTWLPNPSPSVAKKPTKSSSTTSMRAVTNCRHRHNNSNIRWYRQPLSQRPQ